MICKNCGSKYTYVDEVKSSRGNETTIGYCNSCEQNFRIETFKAKDHGEWIMTVHSCDSFSIVVKDAEGKIFCRNYDSSTQKTNISSGGYFTASPSGVYKLKFHSGSTSFYVTKIEYGSELKKLSNSVEALKIIGRSSELSRYHDWPVVKDAVPHLSSALKSSGGCYIATCVYGSYDCPEVWVLRRFRDNTLAKTCFGRLFIKIYYTISPTFIKWFGKTTWFKCFWKNKLDGFVNKLRNNGVEDTPYND